jgi:hypothetical protein
MLIGLTGAAGAGKDTVAALLIEQHGGRVASFAGPLYEFVSAITGIPRYRLADRATKEAVIPWLGKSPRQLLQTLGTEWGRQSVADDIWVRSLLERIRPWLNDGLTVIVTDVRFDNEAEAIAAAGGEVWRVTRPGWRCLSGESASHASEAGVSDHLVSQTIVNDGTLDDLKAVVGTGRMEV